MLKKVSNVLFPPLFIRTNSSTARYYCFINTSVNTGVPNKVLILWLFSHLVPKSSLADVSADRNVKQIKYRRSCNLSDAVCLCRQLPRWFFFVVDFGIYKNEQNTLYTNQSQSIQSGTRWNCFSCVSRTKIYGRFSVTSWFFILPCRVTAHWSHSKSFGDLLAHRSSQLLRSDVRDHQLSGLLAVFSLPASLCIKHQHWEKVLEESEQHRSEREEGMSGFYVVYLLVMNLHTDMGSVLETQ